MVGELGELVITAPMPSMPVGLWGDDDGSRLPGHLLRPLSRASGGTATGSSSSPTAAAWSPAAATRPSTAAECGWAPPSSTASSRSCPRSPTASWSTSRTRAAATASCSSSSRPRARPSSTTSCVGTIRAALRTELSPRHVPDRIVAVPAVPRNLTGKKLELPVKRILQGVPAAEWSSLRRARRPRRRWTCSSTLRRRSRAEVGSR